ncbi:MULTISPECIES: RNA polymerase sigma factor [Sphingobacterium]|uniref:RNA polymerase sigma factor n=1 Tax=Sphingobacterium TaxID=28453 RepID=UPI00257FEACE|nr:MULTISPECIES: RNA polymerase sigma-70 factor [Sphingobacterium]
MKFSNTSDVLSIDQLRDLRAGKIESFNFFYQKYVSEIKRYIKMFLKSDMLTDDVTQEVFVKFWENSSKFESIDNIRGFLYLTAKNASINLLRRSILDEKLVSSIIDTYELEPSVDLLVFRKEYSAYIDKVLETLPQQSRVIFKMCKVEGRSYEEIAERLGISKNTVKKHIVRSLSVLRNDETLKKMNKNLVLMYCLLKILQK